MLFTATTRNSRYFEIMDDLGETIGTLSYDVWTASNATITTRDNRTYKIDAPNFWQTTKLVVTDGMTYATIKPDPGFGLQLYFADGRTFSFKKQSIWTAGNYLLTDDNGQEIASVEANFQWATLSYNYNIDLDINAIDDEMATVLPILMVYVAKYFKIRRS